MAGINVFSHLLSAAYKMARRENREGGRKEIMVVKRKDGQIHPIDQEETDGGMREVEDRRCRSRLEEEIDRD